MVTIKDVAKAANVSVSTVSLVINNSSLVKLETRYKVLQTIKELNYTPNQYARSLVTKNNMVIGVVLTSNNLIQENMFSFDKHIDTFFTEMLPTIEACINKSNFSMLVERFCINNPEVQFPSIMDKSRIDGAFLIGGIVNESFLKQVQTIKIPSVLVGSRHDNFDYVDADYELGAYLGMKHLIEHGHRDILFINGPDYSQTSDKKMSGYKKAMNEFALPIRDEWIAKVEYSGIAAYDLMKRIWEKGIRPTAVFGGTDFIALGALRYVYELGLRCPKDISAVGFEDGMFAEFSLPPLTSVHVHTDQLGKEGYSILLNRMNNPTAKYVKLIIPPKIVERKSVSFL